MKHKILLSLLFSGIAFLISANAAPLPDTNWELKGNKIVNWSGKVTRTANNAMEFSGTTYTKRKYIKGNHDTLNIRLGFQGKNAFIGMYLYDENGALIDIVNVTRIPNAEKKRSFDIVFKIPATGKKNKNVFSFRIYFSAPKKCTISEYTMFLTK